MARPQFGTIAQLVFAGKPPLNFARVVDDLHSVLSRLRGIDLAPDWDCEDVAVFDLPTSRIALGWESKPGKGYAACLTVSVGPLPGLSLLQDSDGYAELCSRLVERFNAHFPATSILWHQTEDPLTGDLIDRLIEDLPPLMQLFPFQEPDWLTKVMAHQSPDRAAALRCTETPSPTSTKKALRTQHAPTTTAAGTARKPVQTRGNPATVDFRAKLAVIWATTKAKAQAKGNATVSAAAVKIANDRPASSRSGNDELLRLREALYFVEPEGSWAPNRSQMRLAIHAMNATLIVVCLPVGSAVMIYSLLKGENLRLTARIMVLSGLFATAV